MMPELDGLWRTPHPEQRPRYRKHSFIFLTAKAEQKDFRQGMNFGADDYITKPFDGLELLKVIELRLKKNDLIKTTFHNSIADIDDFFNKAKQLPDFKKLSENRRSRVYKKKNSFSLKASSLIIST